MSSIFFLKKTCCIVNLNLCHCWFGRDVTATMLVVKNKIISLLWQFNSIFR